MVRTCQTQHRQISSSSVWEPHHKLTLCENRTIQSLEINRTSSSNPMHPFTPFLASHILWVSVPPFLSPSSPYRPLIMALILIACAISLGNTDSKAWWAEQFELYVCGFGLHMNSLINLRRLTPPQGTSRVQKLKWALKRSFDPRSEIAIKDLPPFHVGDPEYIPTKADFLMQRTWTVVWTMGGLLLFRNHSLGLYLADFQSPKHQIVRRLTDVSAREWLVLLQTAFTGWFMPYAFLTAAHSIVSVFAVACGDAPANWRPLFGRIQEAYTLQRFFGWVFPHVLLSIHTRSQLTKPSIDGPLECFGTDSCGKHSPAMRVFSFMTSSACPVGLRFLDTPSF